MLFYYFPMTIRNHNTRENPVPQCRATMLTAIIMIQCCCARLLKNIAHPGYFVLTHTHKPIRMQGGFTYIKSTPDTSPKHHCSA